MTSGTSAGLGYVLAGLDLGPGDEIITSDNEHPGLIGPLIAARQRGATVRAVPFAQLAEAVDARTTLVAASHVNWITGEIAPAELAGRAGAGDPRRRSGRRRDPDRRQGARTAPPTRPPARSGCAAPTAPGCSTSSPSSASACARSRPATARSRTPRTGWSRVLRTTGRRFDGQLSRESVAFSLAALAGAGGGRPDAPSSSAPPIWPTASPPRSPDAGYTVAPRGRSTLVAFEYPDPPAARERLAEAGVAVRDLPGHPYLRASVGAWNDESDLERLLAAL